jgi:hypothetical protein
VVNKYTSNSTKAMAKATTWWKAQTVRTVPVKTGQTKQRIQQFVKMVRGKVIGGLTFGTFYSKWLIFGANVKAKGSVLRKVKKWRIGQPAITQWAAKGAKGTGERDSKGRYLKGTDGNNNPRAQLPMALPFAQEALEVLKENMKG